MTLLDGHFVGRTDELGTCARMLDELDRGRSAAIELVGEPGIGKTRLLSELGARAEARGHLVLAGSASELERDLPFSVFVDALDEYLEGLDRVELAALDDNVRTELAFVFPALVPLSPGRPAALQQERYRCHRAVRALLERLAKTRPLVLVLDDLHWADSASAELIGALLRRPPASAVLLALALRRQVPDRLSVALGRARRAAALSRIELGALTPVEARELLGTAVDAVDAATLYEESGGNPFYLEQLARSQVRSHPVTLATRTSAADTDVPPAVAAALREELALLSEDTRVVLEGAAVAGDPFELELAAIAAGTPEATAMNAIDELLGLDLIQPTDVPRRFRFRHPLVRWAVYDTTPRGWRLGAHEHCSEALAARGASAGARAHHVERSARVGDLAAVSLLQRAGEDAARLAPASAARWFGAALRLLPEAASEETRVALLLSRAASLAAIGQLAASRDDLLDCFRIETSDSGTWRVRIATACAGIEHQLGLQQEAHAHLLAALAELGDPQSVEGVELMIELAVDALHAGDFASMREWAQRSVSAAKPLGDRTLRAAALAVRAWGDAMAGDGRQALIHCAEATELVDELTDEELSGRLATLAHLASTDLYLDRFVPAAQHAQRALNIGRATGQGDLLPLVVAMFGGSLWVQGRPREAEELFDGAVEAARLAGNVHNLGWNLLNRSMAAFAAGDLDVALASAEESVELLGDTVPGTVPGTAGAVLACALLETGQPDRCIDVLLTRAGGEELRLIGGGWRARFLELLTRAQLATGRRADAERAAAAAQACADDVHLVSATAMAGLAAAELALDGGDPATAAERSISAAGALESVGAAFDAARARELAGRAFVRAGDLERGACELEQAALSFDSFGALRYRDRVERELGKLGHRPHRRTRAGKADGFGIESLTERELQVARLVVCRKTNTQIAEELFLSQKTVETHLRNIFHKMDVTTRVALAQAVERSAQDPLKASGRAQ